MRNTITRAIRGVAICAALLLSGCLGFGTAHNDGQRAYLALGQYVYLATPVAEYVAAPGAQAGSVAVLRELDASAHGSALVAVAELRGGGGLAGAAIKVAQENLDRFNLAVFGQADLPDDAAEAVDRGLVLALVGARAIPKMRAWRKGSLKPALATMVEEGRDPSDAEWAAIEARAEVLHKIIQDP